MSNNVQRMIIMPAKTKLNDHYHVTHMQIKKNDQIKKFELRFFNKDTQIVKYTYKDILLRAVEQKPKTIILIEENSTDTKMIKLEFPILKHYSDSRKVIEKILI